MKIEGTVMLEEDEVGTFVVDSDDQIVVEFNGGRWPVSWVFQWAAQQKKALMFAPEQNAA